MKLSITARDVRQARQDLAKLNRRVEPVIRGTLNTTVTHTRKSEVMPDLSRIIAGGRRALNRRLIIKRAGSRRTNARLIPSSSGVEVEQYKRWGFHAVDPTRAIVWVQGVTGRKIAAGFVNPKGAKRKPLRTHSARTAGVGKLGGAPRTYRYSTAKPEPALGPSVAYWFHLLMTGARIRRVHSFMIAEFERRLAAEIEKGIRLPVRRR